jgi:DNA polymerase III alpha subunit
MEHSAGLKFEKFDLHVHTPASFDFSDKTITPEEIVREAKSKGLRGIAITDHNTGHYIDKIIAAAKEHNLAVFPGVEIYCSGGESGIHVIALLDIDKGTKHVEAILSTLKIDPNDFGKKTAVTHKSVFDVIDAITSSPNYGIAILVFIPDQLTPHSGLLTPLPKASTPKGNRSLNAMND